MNRPKNNLKAIAILADNSRPAGVRLERMDVAERFDGISCAILRDWQGRQHCLEFGRLCQVGRGIGPLLEKIRAVRRAPTLPLDAEDAPEVCPGTEPPQETSGRAEAPGGEPAWYKKGAME